MNYIIYNNINFKNAIDDNVFHNLLYSKNNNFIFLENRITFLNLESNEINSINIQNDSIINFKEIIKDNDIFFISYTGNNGQFDNTRTLYYSLEFVKKHINIKIYNTQLLINFINNKHLISQFCKKYNINIPKLIYLPVYNSHNKIINASSLLQDIIDQIKFPMIVKPVAASGGLACAKVNNINEMRIWAEYISFTGYGIIFQEYIDTDYEFRVVTAGRQIFDRHEEHGKLFRYRPTENEFRSRFNGFEFGFELNQEEKEFIQNFLDRLHENYENIMQLGLDIIRGKDGKLYFLEANSSPGMQGYYEQFAEWIQKQ